MSLNHRHSLHSLKMAAMFGGILGLGFSCVISLEPIEPCATGENNKLDDNGECECRIGYEWCDPNDQANLNCCDDGNADDTGPGDGDTGPGDGDGDTGPGDGDGDTGPGDGDGDAGDGDGDAGDGDGDGDGDCLPGELPPETCTVEEEGFFWCTHTDMMGPECSQYFVCENGVWTENNAAMDEICIGDGYDFAYGCVDDGEQVFFECGDGSGAPCNNDDLPFCVDSDLYGYCQFGKETHDSCLIFCQEEGVEGQQFEWGECDASDPNDVQCYCCDFATPGCGE
jgi:hypothetical protein